VASDGSWQTFSPGTPLGTQRWPAGQSRTLLVHWVWHAEKAQMSGASQSLLIAQPPASSLAEDPPLLLQLAATAATRGTARLARTPATLRRFAMPHLPVAYLRPP
jgi:hypothetical protein